MKGNLRRAGGTRVRVRVEEDAVDDVDDAVREQDVGLHDLRCRVAERDVLAGLIQVER